MIRKTFKGSDDGCGDHSQGVLAGRTDSTPDTLWQSESLWQEQGGTGWGITKRRQGSGGGGRPCGSATRSRPTLRLHVDCGTPGSAVSAVSWSLFWFMSVESAMPTSHLILSRPLLLLPSIFPSISGFSSESAFPSGGQRIGVSALASVLPVNIQGWFPLG